MKQTTLVFRVPKFRIYLRISRKVIPIFLILILMTLLGLVINTCVGDYPISPVAVMQTLLGIDTGNPDHSFIIYTLRLPRTLTACLVGIALGIAGTIMQSITRNPLADPGIIGINAGAGLAAVSVIILFPNVPIFSLPLAAFGGALLACLLMYLLAWERGTHPIRLILIGVGIGGVTEAGTDLMIALGNIYDVNEALVWLAGSVYGRSWEQVVALALWLMVFIPLAFMGISSLNALILGDDIAKGLGIRVEWERSFLLLVSAGLSGVAVATAGTIGFIGLIAPHIGRKLVGNSHEGLIPVAGMMGGMLVVWADFLGRVLFSPVEIPCGIITAVIGAPYFVYLLVKSRKK
ncbi:MAG: iron ABC transporter permease [Cyanobacteria bacterium P01_A01_bin.68]